jgi:dephospho-CoA kinase
MVRLMKEFITGMSGTGKSALTGELRRRGHVAYDADDDGFTEPRPNGAWAWNVGLVRELFDRHVDDSLFFSGCSEEQSQFVFDVTVLLTAPESLILDRLQRRTTNSFGKTPSELDLVLTDLREIEPRLRATADLVIETTVPVASVADSILGRVSPATD